MARRSTCASGVRRPVATCGVAGSSTVERRRWRSAPAPPLAPPAPALRSTARARVSEGETSSAERPEGHTAAALAAGCDTRSWLRNVSAAHVHAQRLGRARTRSTPPSSSRSPSHRLYLVAGALRWRPLLCAPLRKNLLRRGVKRSATRDPAALQPRATLPRHRLGARARQCGPRCTKKIVAYARIGMWRSKAAHFAIAAAAWRTRPHGARHACTLHMRAFQRVLATAAACHHHMPPGLTSAPRAACSAPRMPAAQCSARRSCSAKGVDKSLPE
jgi:hypothetical protein